MCYNAFKYKRIVLSLCYLYSNLLTYPHVQTMLDSFDNSKTINLDEITNLDEFDIYIIELNDANKEISQKLVNIFKKKPASLIYFVIPKNHTILLFQLTFVLETKSIITHNQGIEKVIAKIKTDRESFVQSNFERWLGNTKLKTQSFILYRNNNLIFINKLLLDTFQCKNFNQFEETILSNIDITELLQNDIVLNTPMMDSSNVSRNYLLKSVSVSDHEKIIYMEPSVEIEVEKKKDSNLSFMSSRASFIELLKENMLQSNILDKELSILTINIQNIKALLLECDVVEFEDRLLNMLSFMASILEDKLIFSQFENDFYVLLFEDTDFEGINTIAEHFQTKMLNYIESLNKKIILDLFTFHLKEQDFSAVLTRLNEIENGNFKVSEDHVDHIKYLTSKNSEVNIKSLLDDAYRDKSKLKVLNIYNGLVINTSTTILKITDENIYISFEPIQGVVLNLEKQTVLQSVNFSQDIYADVKQINMSKKIAVLENFSFLKTNANSREFARVTTPIKVPISINMQGRTVSGIILDISIKSIAIKIKHAPKRPLVERKEAKLLFNISDKAAEDGYIQLNLVANVIVVTDIDKMGYYKVVCELDRDSHDLDIVLKYVYERQKELIIELKKMSNLN